MMCMCAWYDVYVKLLVFILLSWKGGLMFSIKLGKFSVIISSNIFLLLSLFSSPSDIPILWMLVYLMVLAAHSSILAWKSPWMEEPGGLQSTGSQRIWHGWVTSLSQPGNIVNKPAYWVTEMRGLFTNFLGHVIHIVSGILKLFRFIDQTRPR